MFIVTGANGFIGSQLVEYLNALGIDDIVCTDHITTTERPVHLSRSRFHTFLKPDDLFDYLNTHASRVECVFHLGACSDTQETDIHYLRKNNTEYTNQLFQFCTENPHVTILFASSGAVYGQGDLGFSDEISPDKLTPLNPYGWSKVNTDIWVSEQSRKPPRWFGLRFFNVYGPNESHKGAMRSVVHKAYEQIMNSGSLQLFKSGNPNYPDGRQMRDFVYVKDVIHWTWWIYQNKHVKSGLYNMGYGRARTWLDLAKAVFTSLDRPLNIEWIDMPEDLRARYQYFTEAKMKRLLSQGLPMPKWSLEDGVEDYIKNYLSKGAT